MAGVASGGRVDALQVDQLWVRQGTRDVLQGVSLEVAAGGALLITGANGTGKTTLLRAILGFLTPRRGTVTFGGRPLRSPAAGYVPQESPAGDLPIAAAEVVEIGTVARRLGAAERGRVVAAAMDDAECGHLRSRRYAELSGGERQRVSLARCLAQDARLLLLDEPTSALDAAARAGLIELLERLRERLGLVILMVSHDPSDRQPRSGGTGARPVAGGRAARRACTHLSPLLEALAVAPIARGLAAVLIAGAALPLAGVLVLRLELITLRFTLMHGALLGAAVALAVGLDPLLLGLAVDLLLVITHVPIARRTGLRLSYVSAFLMVITIGAAVAVIYRAAVPAPEVFAVLWGDPFALTRTDLIAVAAFGAALVAFVAIAHRRIAALLFDQEVAASSGIAVGWVRAAVLLAVGCAVAFAMKLIGALLLDAILLLPAILAMALARSVRGLFLLAAAAGLAVAAAGFAVALVIDLPASAGVTLAAALLLPVVIVARRRSRA